MLLKSWKLELWPGYVTSIRQHEKEVLLCCEVSTKILRNDTVLDQLKTCAQSGNLKVRVIVTVRMN